MHQTTFKLLLSFVLSFFLLGCAHRSSVPAVKPKVNTILLLSIDAPQQVGVENASPPVVGILYGGITKAVLDKTRVPEIEALFGEYRKNMGKRLTEALQKTLQAQGFTVRLATSNENELRANGVVNFKKLSTYEAVLDIRFDEVQLYSGRFSPIYWPLLNTSASMVKPSTEDEIFNASIQYGAFARSNLGNDIESNGKFFFPVYADIVQNPSLVREAFDEGIQKTAERIAINLSKEVQVAK